ncbi:two pore domain potassium channel family protein [Pseudomaricurvus alkylphenolicus]|jgi:voltage-gated potassium channel|uniref:potassium channel protein n=1 Tax=Pseudomaricurvus alkylphenolicus TaxID=1306991 RepID=UPI001421A367|nr:potassium channel family protein [Pseudomaricurvus alkylphenolicus]NIB41105.1 two pore domain potassium channel family protein [Pseudomaricurvus alkylphenolicus]
MPVFNKLRKLLLKHFMDMRWHTIVLALLIYLIGSWSLLSLCGESALVDSPDFLYWIVVTASTVGYGDLSPVTPEGRLVTGLFVIPVGLGLFGLAVGRLAAYVSFQWRKGVQGLKSLNYNNHILVIGWNDGRTLQLLRLLLREIEYYEEDQKVALCVRAEIENPMPDIIGFVKVTSFSNDEEMDRAAIEKAGCIIIDNPEDDVTMTTALYVASRNPDAHIIAYFEDEKLGKLLKQHCPNVECMPSVAVEMLAKSAMDPGSSELHHQLLNVDVGMTQYSVRYEGAGEMSVETIFESLKRHYDATLIGVSEDGHFNIELNPRLNTLIKPGSTLYYIADERINHVDWNRLSGA